MLFNKLSSCQRFETPWRLWDVTVIIILQHAALNTWTAPLEAVIVVSSAVTSDQTVKIILMKRIAVSTSFYKFHASTTSLSRLQERRLLRESLEMEKLFHPTLYNGCDFLSMVGLKLTHVSKTGPWLYINRWFLSSTVFFYFDNSNHTMINLKNPTSCLAMKNIFFVWSNSPISNTICFLQHPIATLKVVRAISKSAVTLPSTGVWRPPVLIPTGPVS